MCEHSLICSRFPSEHSLYNDVTTLLKCQIQIGEEINSTNMLMSLAEGVFCRVFIAYSVVNCSSVVKLQRTDHLVWEAENRFFRYRFLVILWFLFGGLLSFLVSGIGCVV